MLNKADLELEVNSERVRSFYHHSYPNLTGYNYTDTCQYSKLWNETNLLCRGIIFDGDKCIARPFSKFFNIEEVEESLLDKKIRKIQNKEDGSLIISYFYNERVNFSTRGSFHSDQAVIAERIWKEKYDHKLDQSLFSDWTFLFELIGPSNINVSRGYGQDDLILLSIISIQTGEEASEDFIAEAASKLGCQRPKLFYAHNVKDLYHLIKENKDPNFEGVVVTFSDGMKVKIKSNLYIQLHKVLTGSLGRDTKFFLWLELNQHGKMKSLETLGIPDEFYLEIKRDIDVISSHYNSFVAETNPIFLEMKEEYNNGASRKEMALKWESFRWLLGPIFSNQEDLSTIYIKLFKKNYMDGIYG